MFWKRKSEKHSLLLRREECNRVVRAALSASGIEFDRASLLQQALVGTFVFGMIYAECLAHSLQPPEVHAIALCVFQDTLHYTPEAAAQGVQACIASTDPGAHETIRLMMHRGIQGYAQHAAGDVDGLVANLRDILRQFAMNG
ncbi:MAG: Imm48 family immunity protein [Verrucomicrobiota bacterium]|nr:Imm48 family immunity protein [Verrucomicrobiota bacterium]